MREWRDSVYRELSGITKEPLTMANGCSPNGVVKKHSLYSRHPRACSGLGREINEEGPAVG